MEKPTKAVLSMVYSMEKAAIHGWTVLLTGDYVMGTEKAMDNSFGPMAITTQGRLADKQHGEGSYVWFDGSIYIGSFVQGEIDGQERATRAKRAGLCRGI